MDCRLRMTIKAVNCPPSMINLALLLIVVSIMLIGYAVTIWDFED